MSSTNGTMSTNITVPSANGNCVTDSPLIAIAVSISPTTSSNLHRLFRQKSLSQTTNTIRPAKVLHPVAAGDLRLLLLENISQGAVQYFKQQGFQVDWHPKAWSEDELVQKIGQYHAIGIRSKTKITEKVIKAASKVTLSAQVTTQ
jgi:D-3-phosphoglycerate dehydrogenase / 2-oxoglutarate reductase